MNANPKFLAATAHVDEAAVQPLPNSRKIYVEGSQPDIRVPMREISQADTPLMFSGDNGAGGARSEPNPPIFVYDCSGPYTDPAAKIDIRTGLPALRTRWIEARGDTEVLADLSSEYGRQQAANPELATMRFPGLHRTPRRAKAGMNVTQMHYARQGIITPEMEFIAIRENNNRAAYLESLKAVRPAGREARRADEPPASRAELRRQPAERDHPRIRAQRNRARPRHHPHQHQPPGIRADDHRPQLPGEDQRQHRQLGARFQHPGRSREDDLGDPLGRRHRDGPVDRQEHPRDARVDHPQLAGADRHRADLPGAGKGRRQGRGTDLGNVPRHADRTGRAGRRLLHHPRRRAAALRADDRQPHDRHRLARRLDHGQVVPRAPQGKLPLHALRGHLRHHEGLRRGLLARRRPASRLDLRRQRRGATGRTEDARRADPGGVEARRAGDDRRPRPRADAADQGEHGHPAGVLFRGAVLHARAR